MRAWHVRCQLPLVLGLFSSFASASASASASAASPTTNIDNNGHGHSSISSVDQFIRKLDLASNQSSALTTILDGYDTKKIANLTTSAKANLACQLSAVVISSNFSTPASADYETLVESYWSIACELGPLCIIEPASAEDVSKALTIITFVGSKFAVRSGGHNPGVGFSGVSHDGILIDMRKLNEVVPSLDQSVVSIGPGSRWGDVYNTLEPLNKTVVGGRLTDVGVGGYMLGGGLSHFSSVYGLAVNHVVRYEVVLANSSIVTASAQENSDLFFALKGGGPNFGIVTKYTLETVPNRTIWVEGLVYDASQFDALISASVAYGAASENDVDASITIDFSSSTCTIIFIYGQPVERPPVYSAYYDIPALETALPSMNSTWVGFNELLSSFPQPQTRVQISSIPVSWNQTMLQETFADFEATAKETSSSLNATMSFVYAPLSAQFARLTKSLGGPTPLNIPVVSQNWLNVVIQWLDPSNDAGAVSALESFTARVQDSAKRHDVLLGYEFMNDAGFFQNTLASYGTESLATLKATARAYDVFDVFQRLQNNGFLLSKT